MISLYQLFYLFIYICIHYANASSPIEQTMEKLIKLISEEQVNKSFFFRQEIHFFLGIKTS
jgi:hypothetical protein